MTYNVFGGTLNPTLLYSQHVLLSVEVFISYILYLFVCREKMHFDLCGTVGKSSYCQLLID